MKKYLSVAIAVIFISCFGLSQADAWNPNGTWVNLDPTSGTQRLEISLPNIEGFGQCTPTPCDWGNAFYTSKLVATNEPTDTDRDNYMAVWLFSFKWTFAFISPHPENSDYIILTMYDIYDIAGDPRANRYTIEYLKKQ